MFSVVFSLVEWIKLQFMFTDEDELFSSFLTLIYNINYKTTCLVNILFVFSNFDVDYRIFFLCFVLIFLILVNSMNDA